MNTIKFCWRLAKYTAIFIFLLLPLMFAGAVILLFVCPFVAKDRLRLPYLCRWFDIVDDYIGRDTSVIKAIYAKGWWARYVYCAWRNSVNYFDYYWLGLKWNGSEVYTRYSSSESDIGDGFNQRPGLRQIEVEQGNNSYWEYYLIYVYPFNKKVCFRFRLGWKIKDNTNKAGETSQWVFVISPWKKYDGK